MQKVNLSLGSLARQIKCICKCLSCIDSSKPHPNKNGREPLTNFLAYLTHYHLSNIMRVSISILFVALSVCLQAQEAKALSFQDDNWQIKNRSVQVEADSVVMNANPGDGLFWLKDYTFENGTLTFEVKGENVKGKSFVGMAFHIQNDSTYDAIYLRPFNFHDSERNSHSVQYISHPKNTWSHLRKEYPGKYESDIESPPDPDQWFEVQVEINSPSIRVFIAGKEAPSLEINKISEFKSGGIGFWVGHNSRGSFRNLAIAQK